MRWRRNAFADPASLPPTLVGPVLQVAAAGGDARLYDQYVARMKAATGSNPEEFYRFFNALPSFSAPELHARTLAFALTEARSQDTPVLIVQLLASGASQEAAWAFVQSEWPALSAKVGTFRRAIHGQRARCVLLGRTWERDQELLRRASRSGGRARAATGLRAHRHLRCRRCTAIAGFRQMAEHSDAMSSAAVGCYHRPSPPICRGQEVR